MNDVVKQPLPPFMQSGLRWIWIAVTVIVMDQLTKLVVVNTMELGESINVLPVFDIYRTYNLGAAWSMFDDWGGIQRWLLSALAIGVSIALVVWLRRIVLSVQPMLVAGLTLILGGAIGNVIDRLRLGHVIDFVLVYWNDAKFPAFNVADAAITIGALLVLLETIREYRQERQAARSNKQAGQVE
jgi:signal peptidase II